MVVSYTVFLVMKFLTLRSLPTESVGLFNAFYYPDYPHALSRQIESVRKYQFKELALYAFQNLF